LPLPVLFGTNWLLLFFYLVAAVFLRLLAAA
jgi:hypothetical protein